MPVQKDIDEEKFWRERYTEAVLRRDVAGQDEAYRRLKEFHEKTVQDVSSQGPSFIDILRKKRKPLVNPPVSAPAEPTKTPEPAQPINLRDRFPEIQEDWDSQGDQKLIDFCQVNSEDRRCRRLEEYLRVRKAADGPDEIGAMRSIGR